MQTSKMYWEEFLSSIVISMVKNAGLPSLFSDKNSALFIFQLEVVLPFNNPHPPVLITCTRMSLLTEFRMIGFNHQCF